MAEAWHLAMTLLPINPVIASPARGEATTVIASPAGAKQHTVIASPAGRSNHCHCEPRRGEANLSPTTKHPKQYNFPLIPDIFTS